MALHGAFRRTTTQPGAAEEARLLYPPPATTDMESPSRVVRACVRCRKQKLKCDAVRPCTLCRRSGFRCEPREGDLAPKRSCRRAKREGVGSPPAISQSQQHSPRQSSPQVPARSPTDSLGSPPVSQTSQGGPTERQRFGANNSAVGFAANIFGNSAASHSNDISSIPGHAGHPTRTMTGAGRQWSLATMRQPSAAVLEALLDVFFDRMHWFVFIFHEPSFRRSARHVLSSSVWQRNQLGTVIACLMTSAIGLQCVMRDPSWTGHALLAESSLDPHSLLDALIKEIRFHLLDLLDDCCIETVQVCSLLGVYYMFHASPTLAWSILGMGVRIAYALALHCDDDDQGYDPVVAQVRRRNWNHITVAETYAAMIYGRPVSLDAAFSFVLPLYDIDDTSLGPALSSHPFLASRDRLSSPVNKLTFHVLKFRLYGIIREALNRFRVLRLHNPVSPDELISMVQAVQHIRSLLESWRASLPPVFDYDPASPEPILGDLANMTDLSHEEQKARRHLLHQVLTLEVTYNCAVIFVHRPLLEYRVAADSQKAVPYQALQVVAESLDLSVSAALRMSRIPVAELEKEFVISFVLMNFFTAGVILCIPPTTWPLSSIANEAKAGTLRIIRANRNLKHDSQIATHTEQLLTGLLKLSLQQEVENGLQQEGSNASGSRHFSREFAEKPMWSTAHDHLPNENEARARDTRCVPIDEQLPNNPQIKLQTPSERLTQSSTEQLPTTTDQRHFSLRNGEVDGNIELMQPSSNPIYNGNHMAAGFDFRWPIAGQHHQVDSQLDEAFGTFGQMLFNLVPDDPYSAWNWGSGAF